MFILRNWLPQLWRLVSPKSAGWSLDTQERANVAVQVQRQPATEFPLAQGTSVFCSIQAFNWYDKAHAYNGGQFAFLKVH